MNKIIDSRVFGGNFREAPSFGNNVIDFLSQNDEVNVIGDQIGDRWIPCTAKVNGRRKNGFVSKNILRDAESNHKESLMRESVRQWLRFDKGDGLEHIHPYSKYVGEFWSELRIDLDGTDRDTPWSAVFISWCVRKAGGYTGFKYSAAHSKYAHQAIRRKLDGVNGPFWGYRITEVKPSLGDIICRPRSGSRITYNFASEQDAFKSHCDIVVRITKNYIVTIGGNLGHSVKRYNYSLNNRGFIAASTKVYAIMKNNL